MARSHLVPRQLRVSDFAERTPGRRSFRPAPGKPVVGLLVVPEQQGLPHPCHEELVFSLHPTGQLSHDEICHHVTEWAFKIIPPAPVPNREDEDSDLSLVETEARQSFLDICEEVRRRREQRQTDGHDQGEEGSETVLDDIDMEEGEESDGTTEEEIERPPKRILRVEPPEELRIPPWMRNQGEQ